MLEFESALARGCGRRRRDPRQRRRGRFRRPRSAAASTPPRSPAPRAQTPRPLFRSSRRCASASISSTRRAPPTCTGAPPARTSPTPRWCCSLEQARVPIAADHGRLDRALRELSERHAADGDAGPHAAAAGHADHVRSEGRGLDVGRSRTAGAVCTTRGPARWSSSSAAPPARSPRSAIRASAWSPRRRASSTCVPAPPWHTDRDRLGALVTACGLYVAALGKVARDITLLMQAEVGEAAEPGGGSSTMPHKQNPVGMRGGAGGGDAHAGARRRVPDGDDSGARAQRRRQPGRVADRRPRSCRRQERR